MKNNFTAVILAAGMGTRMLSEKPKVLHEVCGKPMLGHVIDACAGAGIKDIIIVAGTNFKLLKEYTGKNYENLGIKFAIQKPALGTAHAVGSVFAKRLKVNNAVLILSGDAPLITSDTILKFIEVFNSKKSGGIIAVCSMDDPKEYGRIIAASDGSVERIVEENDADEKQKSIKLINGGVYIIRKDLLIKGLKKIKKNPKKGEFYLTDIAAVMSGEKKPLIPVMAPAYELAGVNNRKQLAEISEIMNKKNLEKMALNGITIEDFNTVFIEDGVKIGRDTVIRPFTVIRAKSIIGKNCIIGPSAHIRPGTVIGNNVKIGNYVEIKNSVIGDNTAVSHLSYIGDAELGKNVNIGAGTITANYDGKNKHKTVIGDFAYVGSNTVFVAPVKIGKNTVIGAGSVITEDVPDYSLAVARQRQVTKTGYMKGR